MIEKPQSNVYPEGEPRSGHVPGLSTGTVKALICGGFYVSMVDVVNAVRNNPEGWRGELRGRSRRLGKQGLDQIENWVTHLDRVEKGEIRPSAEKIRFLSTPSRPLGLVGVEGEGSGQILRVPLLHFSSRPAFRACFDRAGNLVGEEIRVGEKELATVRKEIEMVNAAYGLDLRVVSREEAVDREVEEMIDRGKSGVSEEAIRKLIPGRTEALSKALGLVAEEGEGLIEALRLFWGCLEKELERSDLDEKRRANLEMARDYYYGDEAATLAELAVQRGMSVETFKRRVRVAFRWFVSTDHYFIWLKKRVAAGKEHSRPALVWLSEKTDSFPKSTRE